MIKGGKMAKRKRPGVTLPDPDTSLALPWNVAPWPSICYGVGNLWQGLMDIMTIGLGPTSVSSTWLCSDYAATLASDARALLNDAKRARQQLLSVYPQLRPQCLIHAVRDGLPARSPQPRNNDALSPRA